MSVNQGNMPFTLGVSAVKNLHKDSSGRFIVPPGMEKVRVPIWNVRDGRKLGGCVAPELGNLNEYFARNANCEVYTGQLGNARPVAELRLSDAKALQKDNSGVYIAPKGLEKLRVPIWNLRDGRKLMGRNCPEFQNLSAYLARKPHCDVFTGQTRETHPPQDGGDNRVTVWDRDLRCKLSGNAAPLESSIENYLKKHPSRERYVDQDMFVNEFGVRLRDDSAKAPMLVNLNTGFLVFGNARPLKRNLSQYLHDNKNIVVYDKENKDHRDIVREAKRAKTATKRMNSGIGHLPPPSYRRNQQAFEVSEEELEIAIESMEIIDLEDNTARASVPAQEADDQETVHKFLEELDGLLGMNTNDSAQ